MHAAVRRGRLQITEDPITKDLPSSLQGLPDRRGGHAQIAHQFPCPQLTQVDRPTAQDEIVALAVGWPGVSVAEPRQTIPGARALVLARELALGQGEAFILGREFAHVRAEGSVHAALAPEWGELVMQRGWGRLHPLALFGLIQPQSLVFYAPRDADELHTIERILIAAYAYACGRRVEREP